MTDKSSNRRINSKRTLCFNRRPDTKSHKRGRKIIVGGQEYATITDAILVHQQWLSTLPRWTGKNFEQVVKAISERLRLDWTGDQAFDFVPPPACATKGEPHRITCNGIEYPSITAFAKSFNLDKKVVFQQLVREEWPPEAIVGLAVPPDYRERYGSRTGHIYLCRHLDSERGYVGLSIDGDRRQWQHAAQAKSGKFTSGTLQHAIALHGIDRFVYSIVEDNVPGYALGNRERYWIKKLNTLKPHGFNQNAGGVAGSVPARVKCDGIEYASYARLAAVFGVPEKKIRQRRQNGWSIEEAVELVHRITRGTKILLDMGESGPTVFPSAAAACRMIYVAHGPLARLRELSGRSWQDIISDVWHAKLKRDEAESPQFFSTYERRV